MCGLGGGLSGVGGGVSGPGVCAWSRGCVCLVWGEVCLVRGVCVWSGGGVPGPGGVVCLVWGCVSDPGGVPGLGVCVCLVGGVCLSALWDTTTPPVNRMTNRCKNITLATTSLRPVINNHYKTIYGPDRSGYSSCKVIKFKFCK